MSILWSCVGDQLIIDVHVKQTANVYIADKAFNDACDILVICLYVIRIIAVITKDIGRDIALFLKFQICVSEKSCAMFLLVMVAAIVRSVTIIMKRV